MADALILDQFLARADETPIVWGAWDCHLWLADWIMAARGCADPAAAYRGRYRTPLGALRLLNREGGSAALVGRVVEGAGLHRGDPSEPGSGDVGLLPCISPRGVELIGGLFTGRRWSVLSAPSGLLVHPAQATCVWRI
jgi:hypothetical protein